MSVLRAFQILELLRQNICLSRKKAINRFRIKNASLIFKQHLYTTAFLLYGFVQGFSLRLAKRFYSSRVLGVSNILHQI